VGQVPKIRFHHLRHTTASLLLMNGADLAAVERIMRPSRVTKRAQRPHLLWIVNSIRIRPADLEAFLERPTLGR